MILSVNKILYEVKDMRDKQRRRESIVSKLVVIKCNSYNFPSFFTMGEHFYILSSRWKTKKINTRTKIGEIPFCHQWNEQK